MKYQIKPKPTLYNDVQYRSRLEAKWACFFDLMNWKYSYEPHDLPNWSPDFYLKTEAGSSYLVEVKPNIYIDLQLRLKLGEASNFSSQILLLDDCPFSSEIPNVIGLSSIFGKIRNYKEENDFEFSLSVISTNLAKETDIINLCDSIDFDHKQNAQNEFKKKWLEACNTVQFLKPN
jgi:hypothetical protein